jgi:hypothetical protein
MHAQDRYALALALLEGDRDSRQVLADLLEEQADRGLAQWARGGSNSTLRRLEFAMMLLPCRAALGLAIGFMEHAFTVKSDAALFRPLAARIKQWCGGQFSGDELVAHCVALISSMPQDWGFRPKGGRRTGVRNTHLKSAIQSLGEAVQSAVNVEQAAQGAATSGTPRHWETMALQHLRAVARAGQNQALPSRSPATATPTSTELDWQIEQAKILFQQLLAEESPWPR